MKAVVCQYGELRVTDRPEPRPGPGHVLIDVLRCGICGSDLHARHHCDHWADLNARTGYKIWGRSKDEQVFGHEFCGEVVEHGPGCARTHKVGSRVVALPALRHDGIIEGLGFSATLNGGYAERMLIDESLTFSVPNGLSSDMAALTEPMAVGWHAVRRSEIKRKDVAIVIGCGPVGLAIICMLKAAGVQTVVAADFSPGRRALAQKCGATVLVDPKVESPYANWKEYGFIPDTPAAYAMGMEARDKLGKLPIPWWHAWRIVELLGFAPKRPVIFECVGAPGLLASVIEGAPLYSRIIAVGVCMKTDQFEPALASNKEVELRFVMAYTPVEYHDALHMIAEGKVQCAPLITGLVGLDGVESAFEALGNPEQHAKILIDPKSPATRPVPPVA
jgi:threonine dehydrogenase-like Zn-dependent dehydrogenase